VVLYQAQEVLAVFVTQLVLVLTVLAAVAVFLAVEAEMLVKLVANNVMAAVAVQVFTVTAVIVSTQAPLLDNQEAAVVAVAFMVVEET
jgi:hypothetical protein